jgi:hypothetical protein
MDVGSDVECGEFRSYKCYWVVLDWVLFTFSLKDANQKGSGCSSVVGYFSSTCEASSSIPGSRKQDANQRLNFF